MRYKLEKKTGTEDIRADGIIKLDDSGNWLAWVPNDSANRDWQEYQSWLAEDNEPDAAD